MKKVQSLFIICMLCIRGTTVMKRIILSLAAILLLFAACEKSCLEKRPKNVKPIDWENYNDVYTAFWNAYSKISESSYMRGQEIMVYGWVEAKYSEDGFILVTNTNDTDKSLPLIGKPHLDVRIWGQVTPIHEKLDSYDLTKKCYVKGKLEFNVIHKGMCSIAIPEIIIENIDDFYFE